MIDPATGTHYGTGYERSRLFPGGLLAMAVCRSASLPDGLYADWPDDPVFRPIVNQDLAGGQLPARIETAAGGQWRSAFSCAWPCQAIKLS